MSEIKNRQNPWEASINYDRWGPKYKMGNEFFKSKICKFERLNTDIWRDIGVPKCKHYIRAIEKLFLNFLGNEVFWVDILEAPSGLKDVNQNSCHQNTEVDWTWMHPYVDISD